MEGAIRRGIQWLLSMQNRDGGWGASIATMTAVSLHIPFADHNAMIDPSTADVTAASSNASAVSAGLPSIPPFSGRQVPAQRSVQRRLLVRPLGCELHLRQQRSSPRARNRLSRNARLLPARRHLASHRAEARRHFGESLRSYDEPLTKGRARAPLRKPRGSHRSLAGTDVNDSAVTRAVSYLVHQQREDGSWSEPDFTGTGFRSFLSEVSPLPEFLPGLRLARYSNQSRRAEDYAALKFQPSEFRLRSGF